MARLPDDRFEHVEVGSAAELRRWLEAHHGREEAVWLVTWKKSAGARYVSRDAVLDELTCFGWIDGIMRRVDDLRVKQLVSPRRARPWLRSYQERATRLIATGRMHPAGLAAVESARMSGAWDELAHVDDLVVPEDLAAALSARPGAREAFDTFPPSHRRNVLRWIAVAKREETRRRRVEQAAEDAHHGIRTRTNG